MKEHYFEEKLSDQYKNIPVSFVRSILSTAGKSNIISFAGGLPNPDFFPEKELCKSAREVMNKSGKTILQYSGSLGYYPLREWIATRYKEKYSMNITPEMVVITNGSQQAIDITAKLFLNKKDKVLLEKPSYLGAIQALSAYQPEFCEINLENDGPDLSQVESHYLNNDIKLMYAVPNAQNPSGISYSEEKRIDLAILLQKYNQFLLEDDPYNEICFDGSFPPPIKMYAPENVAWTGSFSKMVAPGLRNGWIILPEKLVPHFDKAKQSTDLNPNNLTQYAIHHYLSHHSIDEHLEKINQKYKQQCIFMMDMIKKYLPGEVFATNPSGGMFIWLSLPKGIDSGDLIQQTLKRGVVFVPGNSFYTNSQGKQNIRMNFTNACSKDIEKGVRIIGEEMKTMLQS